MADDGKNDIKISEVINGKDLQVLEQTLEISTYSQQQSQFYENQVTNLTNLKSEIEQEIAQAQANMESLKRLIGKLEKNRQDVVIALSGALAGREAINRGKAER